METLIVVVVAVIVSILVLVDVALRSILENGKNDQKNEFQSLF